MTDKKRDPREGHRGRLRDKFLEHGLDKLTEAEVLELLLSFGTPRKDCKLAARTMLETFGSIRNVFEADPKLLSGINGAGPANIVAIKFIHAVAGKYLEQRLEGRSYLNSSREIFEYLRHDLENLDHEVFKVIYMDHSNAIIKLEDISRGSITEAHVHPRQLVARAIALKATCLVFVHNHPSGNTEPSDDDQKLTRRLVHVSHMMEMIVYEHIIIGKNGEYFSFRDEGLIAIYFQEVRETYRIGPRPGGGLLHEQSPLTYNPRPRHRRRKSVAAPESPSAFDGGQGVMLSEKVPDLEPDEQD